MPKPGWVKKIGKAKLDLKKELWYVDDKEGAYINNRRLVDTRKDLKALKLQHSKGIGVDTPSRRKPTKRQEYFKNIEAYQKERDLLLAKIYEEIRAESFNFPIPLCKDRDYEHKSDWRYCMYKGIIYQFDRPGYMDDEMIPAIEALEVSSAKR